VATPVATVALWGPSAATAPTANDTVAVAAGTTSRIATQSVSPVIPSNGLATNGAGPAANSPVRVPRTLSLLELITHFLDFQREIVSRRSKDELRKKERRAHILAGYLICTGQSRRGDQADSRSQ